MFNLGYMHLKGIHVRQNTSQAVYYFQQAASRGLAAGHNGLGVLAFHGQGVQRDLAAAKAHFEAGAAQGSADSMYNLGGMHMEGERPWSRVCVGQGEERTGGACTWKEVGHLQHQIDCADG
jgi:TPR repeat protein